VRLKREISDSEVEGGSEDSSQYDTADSDSGKEMVRMPGTKRRKEWGVDGDSGLGSSRDVTVPVL
jgi:hypothetical protein